jgi:GT2 family glycosyltransferase
MPRLTSIILTAYNQTQFQAHMTMAVIANLTRYTNPEEYELILMSDSEKFPVRDDYKVLKIDKYIKSEGWGYTKSMNEGAKLANGEYLIFMQNDVFVFEGWLEDLRDYMEMELCECIIPDQMPRPRDFVLQSYQMSAVEAMQYGSRDAGLLMIRKSAFKRTGGWDERQSLLAEKDFYQRMAKAGVIQRDTCRVMISHIMAATNLYRLHTNPKEYDDLMAIDAKIQNG